MATRREVMGGLVALLLPLMGTQALAQAPASSAKTAQKPATQSLSSSLGVSVYPSKGQSAAQQQKDETECFTWAQQQSGVNPLNQATAVATPAPQGGHAASGAAKGAVGGAAVGIITGRPGRGAAVGATTGAMVGAAHDAQQQGQAQAQAQAQNQQAQQERAAFNRSFGACLDGRGYSVK